MEDPFAPKCQPMPDCMMPDGTEPCAGFRVENERHNQEREANNALHAEVERLQKENFALASGMCHDGYGDEGGSWRCKYQDEIERLRVVIVVAKDALLDVQSMQWVHDLLASALHRPESKL